MSDLTVEAHSPPRVSSQDRLLAMIQKKRPDYHPILAMVEMAHDIELKDDHLKFQCHKEVARYVVQVDKFVEVKSEVKQTKRVVVELFGDRDQRSVALENAPSPVLEQTGVSDVVDKLAQRGGAEVLAPAARMAEVRRGVSVDTFEETSSVRSTGGVDHDPLADAWEPDVGAARFA